MLQKREDNSKVGDKFPMTGEYPDLWGVLEDNRYQRVFDVLQAVIPRKKSARGNKPWEDEL